MMGLLDKLRRLFGTDVQPPPVTPPSEGKSGRNAPSPTVTVERPRPVPDLTGPRQAAGPEYESRYLSATEAGELLVPGPDGKVPVRIRDGFFQHVPTGKRVSPANRTLNKHGLVSFRVRGDAYYDSKAADTRAGQRALLVREPGNKHDPNAVAVHALDKYGERVQVGYVNKGLARRLAKQLDAGDAVVGWFMRGDEPGRDDEGVAVVLTDEDEMRRLLGP